MDDYIEFDAATNARYTRSDLEHHKVNQSEPISSNRSTPQDDLPLFQGQYVQSIVIMLHMARLLNFSCACYTVDSPVSSPFEKVIAIKTPGGNLAFPIENDWMGAILEQVAVPDGGVVHYLVSELFAQTNDVTEHLKFIQPEVQSDSLNGSLKDRLECALEEALHPKVIFDPNVDHAALVLQAFEYSQRAVRDAVRILNQQ